MLKIALQCYNVLNYAFKPFNKSICKGCVYKFSTISTYAEGFMDC